MYGFTIRDGQRAKPPYRCKAGAQFISRYALATVELCQTALDLGANGFFVFLKPDLALRLHFECIEEHVLHALEGAAMQALLNKGVEFGTVDLDGHCIDLAGVILSQGSLSLLRLYQLRPTTPKSGIVLARCPP
jgi:hypothetical protein